MTSLSRIARIVITLLIAFAAASLDVAPSHANADDWVAISLGTLVPDQYAAADVAESGAFDINADNVIVGYATANLGQQHAFRWSGGTMQALPRLPETVESGATAINDAGVIVGQSTFAAGNRHATVWTEDEIRDLGTLGGRSSMAWDLNMVGTVVGWAETTDGRRHAALWNDGSIVDLGTLGGDSSEAYGVSPSGAVLGMSQVEEGAPRPFIWQAGLMRELPIGAKAVGGYAVDMNAEGVIAGVVVYDGAIQSAAFWTGDELVTLLEGLDAGVRPSSVLLTESGGIGESGLLVGAAGISGPAIWQDGSLTQLPMVDQFHSGGYAYSINASGWIVGITFVTGAEGLPIARATLWVPISDASKLPFPAPATHD